MILYVFDRDFTLVGMMDSFISVIWEEDYRGIGKFYLECVDSQFHVSLLHQGYYIARKGKDTAMVIRYVNYDSTVNKIIVRGYVSTDILSQRVVFPTQTIQGVERGMYSLVTNNARNMDYLTVAAAQGLPDTTEMQFTGDGLVDALIDFASVPDYGFKTIFDITNKQHIFTVYQGLDRSDGNGVNPVAIFTDEVGNLNNLQIIDDDSIFKNFAYVGGMGEGVDRIWTSVYSGDSEPMGKNRFEMTVDARDIQKEEGESNVNYITRLRSRGLARLSEHYNIRTFLAEPDTQKENPTLRWGVDYYLGDIVSCKSSKYSYRIDTRIMKYTETQQNNITTIVCTLGDPIITERILTNLRS